jgi:hypothetical protein
MPSYKVTIKAQRERGGTIEWCYDTPKQCAKFWRDLVRSGEAPDTGEKLSSAAMFIGAWGTPDKVWSRTAEVTNLRASDVGI